MLSGLVDFIPATLLAVELILLIVTLFVVQASRRESKGQTQLIQEMYRTAKIVSREDYFNSVMNGYQIASSIVLARVTGKKPSGDEMETTSRLLSLIEEVTERGIKINFLLPKSPERLYMGYRYTKAGAEVRYHSGIIASDLRYMIIDAKTVVLGLSGKTGEQDPTRTGYRIPSEGLANVLKTDFITLWESAEATDYEEYVRHLLLRIKKANSSVSIKLLSDQLDLDVEETSRLLNQINVQV
jgi:hypothetical protein